MDPLQTPPPPNFSQKPKFHIFLFLKPSLNTQVQEGAGLKYYWIRNKNFYFSLPLSLDFMYFAAF